MPKNIFGDEPVSAPTSKNVFGDDAISAAPAANSVPQSNPGEQMRSKALGMADTHMDESGLGQPTGFGEGVKRAVLGIPSAISNFYSTPGYDRSLGEGNISDLVPAMGPLTTAGRGDLSGAAGEIAGMGAVSALTHGASKGMQKLAPPLMERGLGIRNPDRAFDRTPGVAALNETTGVHPETVSESAGKRIDELLPEYENTLANSGAQVSMIPTRTAVTSAQAKLGARNATSAAERLQPISDFLNHADSNFKGSTTPRFGPATQQPITVNGQPLMIAPGVPATKTIPGAQVGTDIAGIQPARAALDLKRGLNDEFINGKWNPDNAEAHGTAKKAYGVLDKSIDAAVPDSEPLNQRISSLIPVKKRGASTARNEDLGARMVSRVAARTGGLLSAAAGAAEGHRLGGGPGAAIGGLVGLGIPELISSPTAQIAGARTLHGVGNLGEKLAPILPFLNSLSRQKEDESETEKNRIRP